MTSLLHNASANFGDVAYFATAMALSIYEGACSRRVTGSPSMVAHFLSYVSSAKSRLAKSGSTTVDLVAWLLPRCLECLRVFLGCFLTDCEFKDSFQHRLFLREQMFLCCFASHTKNEPLAKGLVKKFGEVAMCG